MTPEEAIEIVAKRALENHILSDIEDIGWDLYPEIGEHDWEMVLEKIRGLAPHVADADYEAAYALLEARAEKESV